MSALWLAFGFGLISALSLPLGAITALLWRLEARVIAAMMAFGGGALLAALTLDLVAPALQQGHYAALCSGFLAGGLLFIALNLVVNDFGGFRRKVSTTVHHSRRESRRRLKRVLSHLNRTPIFEDLSDDEVTHLAASVRPVFYPAGSHIYRKGDPADAIYVVFRGEVEICDVEGGTGEPTHVIDDIGSGGAFGADSLFTGSPHHVTATAIRPTWGWCIPEAGLRRLLGESEIFRRNVRAWLDQPRIRRYLLDEQGLSEPEVDAWFEGALTSLDTEGRLPDARPVERHAEAFRSLAPQLDRLPWLEELTSEEAEWLSLHLVYRQYRQGELLFREGDPSDRLFILEDGGISVWGSRNRLPSRYEAGDGIGVRAFITGVRHTVTAHVTRSCGAWTLRREDFNRLLAHYPDIRDRLAAYLQTPVIRTYLRQRYQLDRGTIDDWVSRALKAVRAGRPPPGLLSRGVESGEPAGASLAIWLGILLDGIPESLVIGASVSAAGISPSLVVGLFLANYPEALSSSQGMLEEKFSRRRILLMWTSIMLLTGVGAAIGKLVMDVANPLVFALLEGLAAGAMLTMIAQTMLPEANIKGGSIIGLWTLLGFLCAIMVKAL